MGQDHKGQPSGTNKQEGTGLTPGTPGDEKQDKKITETYTDGEDNIADNAPSQNPNRNTDKQDATNAGGYKQ